MILKYDVPRDLEYMKIMAANLEKVVVSLPAILAVSYFFAAGLKNEEKKLVFCYSPATNFM